MPALWLPIRKLERQNQGAFRTLINYVVEGVRVLFHVIRKLIDSIRRLLVFSRKSVRQPLVKEIEKEIIKEVPIEKIVTTEIPVEILKKEIVYVPMYTNDKDLLKMSDIEIQGSEQGPRKSRSDKDS